VRAVLAALAAVVAALAWAAASAVPAAAQSASGGRPLIEEGPTGRTLLGGTWRHRRDPRDQGLDAHWERSRSTRGWSAVTVPHAWNAGDTSLEGFIGDPAWYRKDFRLPGGGGATGWRIRFEAVNYRSTIWLNGRRIGQHEGAFVPFELPLRNARRGGVNRLVVRVDNRRLPFDFPPSQYTRTDEPRGGWWNYGGILREVYLRPVDRVDFESVQVRPEVACARCPARVRFAVAVRNDSDATQRVRLAGAFGDQRVRFPATRIPRGSTRTLLARIGVARPRLWSPGDPYLYPVALDLSAGGRSAGRYELRTGIRSVTVSGDGRLLLNGAPLNVRGVGLHEDMPGKGAALDSEDRGRLIAEIRELGATMARSHYPLHPRFHELADRAGLLVWTEVPVYRMDSDFLAPRAVRAAAVDLVRRNILTNQNRPSVIVWSVGNELEDTVPWPVRTYIAAAARAARRMDPSRPVGMAIEGHPRVGCRPGYEPLDVIGLNDYFGWYTGQVANREDLSGYLDAMRACHPRKALLVTEFGAEANRDGPVEEKGTYQFQQDWIRYHLSVFQTKPWLSGISYWALREFLVRPGWAGGNPLPQPPMHQKGVITYDGRRKPAYADLQQNFRATPVLLPAAR